MLHSRKDTFLTALFFIFNLIKRKNPSISKLPKVVVEFPVCFTGELQESEPCYTTKQHFGIAFLLSM